MAFFHRIRISSIRLVVLSFCIILMFCKPKKLNEADIAQIKAEAASIFKKYTIPTGFKTLYLEPNNSALIRMGIKGARLRVEGLYFVTSEYFVEERGYFIPRNNDQEFFSNTDPGYEILAPGLFYYRVKG